ncbi:MAG: DUF3593 domain-containing protein [Chlorobiaceae bacterium]|nr:DUF3593 domain-containing protein [Chlorobiaceae bacterium]NTV59912.1 DUF3593 domain-containing protein [Chlorobiaceae bacterium]
MNLAGIGLLSLPNWAIHISSSLEWGVASLLIYRYGKLCARKEIRIFGLSMLPHWIGSLFILAYHITTDSIALLLDLSEVINLFGSISLLMATINLLKAREKRAATSFAALMAALMFSGKPQSYLGEDIFDAILQVSSIVYLTFLILLVVLYRRDKSVFSGLTVAGFWFVVVFISVTVFFMYLATVPRGYASLSHDDLLHGSAESLLTMSNLMIALGAHRQIRKFEAGKENNQR